MPSISKEKVFGGILGLIAGDALGVPVEGCPREVLAADPVSGMRGYGVHRQPPGTWSDDSSLARLDDVLALFERFCHRKKSPD